MIYGSRTTPLTATYVKRRALLGASVVFALLAVWGIHHVLAVKQVIETGVPKLAFLYAFLFIMLVWQTFYGYFEKPYTVTAEQADGLAGLSVAVIVPLYNEDPKIVRESIESMLRQSRPVQAISVCDDGSNLVDYAAVVEWFHDACDRAEVAGYWTRQQNAGKRHAQVTAQQHVAWCDVYALVDSDSLMDVRATEEALKPFADPRVMSVAAMVGAANTRQNLFTRVMDLWYVALQFTDRSIMSRFNSVLVNYGALAYYRAEVLNDNVDAYLNETFAGQPMSISDDSLLTLYALTKGKTVQQISAWAFTYMPTTFKHHKNQQIRWMRGSFIRSMWRFRYLPVARFAFWAHLFKWFQYVIATAAFVGVLLTQDMTSPRTIGLILLIQSCIYYGVMLRYFSVRRSDESLLYQLGTWAMTPIAAIWAATFLRTWRIWAMITCTVMAWGTRDKVEVNANVTSTSHRVRRPVYGRIAAVGAFMVVAFAGTGWFFLHNVTPDNGSVIAQAQNAGMLPDNVRELFLRPTLPTTSPTATPTPTTVVAAPDVPQETPSVRRTPTPTRTTVRPSARPTTVRPTTPRVVVTTPSPEDSSASPDESSSSATPSASPSSAVEEPAAVDDDTDTPQDVDTPAAVAELTGSVTAEPSSTPSDPVASAS